MAAVRQFIHWDVSPANHRSYGLNQFADLDGDGKLDFLCLGYFAKHYEVLLNRDGKLQEAWHCGWEDSVTTSKVAVTWPLPAYASIDGAGKQDVWRPCSMAMQRSNGRFACTTPSRAS